MPPRYDVSETNVLQVIRPDSLRLLIVFSGLGKFANQPPFEFLRKSGFMHDSLIYMRDVHRDGYRQGVSAKLGSFERLRDWCVDRTRELSHVNDINVVGASSGGITALLVARAVGARRAVVFAPRTVRAGTFRQMNEKGHFQSVRHRWRVRLHDAVARTLKRPARDWATPRDLDVPWLDYAIETLKEGPPGGGPPDWRYHSYFIARNRVDSLVAARLADCPGIHIHEVEVPDSYSTTVMGESGWDHEPLSVLRLTTPLSGLLDQ